MQVNVKPSWEMKGTNGKGRGRNRRGVGIGVRMLKVHHILSWRWPYVTKNNIIK